MALLAEYGTHLWYEITVLLVGLMAMFRDWFFTRRISQDLPSQSGRVAVITGGSRGIGLETVKKMLELDMHLVIGSSNVESAEKVLKPLLAENGGKGKLDVWPLDLAKQKSVHDFCDRFLAADLPLHVLLCNAGIMFYPRHQLTEDGFETQLAVNHLGHFTLQHRLLPKLAASGSAERRGRIVNVSSAAHNCCSGVNFDDIMMTNLYSPKGAYFQSKGVQILCTKYLAQKLSEEKVPVTCTSLHPGVIYTDLYNYTFYKFISPVLKKLWKSPKEGAETLLFAALSPEAEGMNGVHFENAAVYKAAGYTEEVKNQQRAFEMSCEFCKINNFGKPEAK